MPQHVAKQGDTIVSIADRYGFNWERIWNLPENAKLKQTRKDPGVLYPNDVVVIPEIKVKTVSAEMCVRHRFRYKRQMAIFRVTVEDSAGKACPGKKFVLYVDGSKHEGTTDSSARIEQEIPANSKKGKLTVWLEDEDNTILKWDLQLGYLDPVETATGVQARLANLGFPLGEITGQIGPETESAIRSFQIVHGLTVNGELNDEVRNKLKELHDKN